MKIEIKLNEFKKIFKPSLYTGVGLLRIARDEKGKMIINPKREILATKLANVSEEGDEFKYSDVYEMPFGFTGYESEGGVKRVSKEEYDKLDFQAKEKAMEAEKLATCRISILMEGQIESKDEKGATIIETLYDLIQFKFIDAARFNSEGTKMQVFNMLGQTNWIAVDKVFAADFRRDVDVKPAYDKVGDFGIEELIDFIYSYGAISKGEKGVALLQELNFDDFFKGDASSLVDLLEYIEAERISVVNTKKIELYGIMALATPINNKGTGNKNSQTFYPTFERGIADEEGNINESFTKIKGSIAKARTPNKKTGMVYSPESKGVYVGPNNQPVYGFRRIDEKVMDAFIIANGVNNFSRPIVAKGNAGPAGVQESDNVFGI